LSKIFDILGSPSAADLAQLPIGIQDRLRQYRPRGPVSFNGLVSLGIGDAGVSLLEGMLQFSPCKRITMVRAVHHCFFSRVHRGSEEGKVAGGPINMGFNEGSPRTLSNQDDIRAKIRENISEFHPRRRWRETWRETWESFITRTRPCFTNGP